MNGPEHYAKAERILGDLNQDLRYKDHIRDAAVANAFAEAQVHASLAVAAAIALQPRQDQTHGYIKWLQVAT